MAVGIKTPIFRFSWPGRTPNRVRSDLHGRGYQNAGFSLSFRRRAGQPTLVWFMASLPLLVNTFAVFHNEVPSDAGRPKPAVSARPLLLQPGSAEFRKEAPGAPRPRGRRQELGGHEHEQLPFVVWPGGVRMSATARRNALGRERKSNRPGTHKHGAVTSLRPCGRAKLLVPSILLPRNSRPCAGDSTRSGSPKQMPRSQDCATQTRRWHAVACTTSAPATASVCCFEL